MVPGVRSRRPLSMKPSRRPQCAVVNAMIHAPRSGRLVSLPIADAPPADWLTVDVDVQLGEDVQGPEEIFATTLAEVTFTGKDLTAARAMADRLLADPPEVTPAARSG